MMGETFSSCVVSMPMEDPPTLTPERSVCGMGTTSEAIPRTTNITPTQNSILTVFSFFAAERAPAWNSITPAILLVPATLGLDADKPRLLIDKCTFSLTLEGGYPAPAPLD